MRILGLGDNVCDVYLHTQTMYPGGQALNVAVYAQSLGARAEFLGVFGTDQVASHVQDTLLGKGIPCSHSRIYPGANGVACVKIVDGDRIFVGSNKGGVMREHPLVLSAEDLAYADGFDIIHTSNNSYIEAQLPKLRTTSAFLSYDFSGKWREEERKAQVCPHVDAAFLSCSGLSDAATMEVLREFRHRGCRLVVATRGDQSAMAYDGERCYTQAVHPVDAVDTMGAGDSFAASLLVSIGNALAANKDALAQSEARARLLTAALEQAAVFAASTCLVNGAFGCGAPLPDAIGKTLLQYI